MLFTYLHPLYRSGFINMLKNIHIKDPYKVYKNYILSAGVMTSIDQSNMVLPTDKTKISRQNIEYKFDNIIFILYESKSDNNGYVLSIRKKHDDKNYLHIITSPIDNVAIINSISYYKKESIIIGLEYQKSNIILLKMCIHYMKENKDKYKIKRLLLTDNSFYRCHKNDEIIILPLLNTLLYGNTIYGEYGFRPYMSDNKSLDPVYNDFYNRNYRIATTTKIKDTGFSEICKDILLQKRTLKIIEKYCKKYENLTINKFFQTLIMNVKCAYPIISSVYISFCVNVKIYDFSRHDFFLDL